MAAHSAWAALLAAYGDVGATGQLLAVTGEAGIGKTRLVEAFLAHARDSGAVAVAATGYEGETAWPTPPSPPPCAPCAAGPTPPRAWPPCPPAGAPRLPA